MNTEIVLPIALDLLVKSTGILLLSFAVQALWRRASAAQRCLVWGATFAVMLLLPFTQWVTPRWSFALERPHADPPLAALMPAPMMHADEDWTPLEDLAIEPAPSALPSMPQWSAVQIAGGVWMAGIMLALGQRLLGAWQVRRLRSRSRTIDDGRTSALATRLVEEFGIVRRIAWREGEHVSVPLTWGVFRPVVLLPHKSSSWSDAELEAALRHELGHVRHFDAATRLLACVVCAVFWPNVLVWLAAKAWQTAQEQACDDLVLRAGAATQEYAMQLLHAARDMKLDASRHAPVMAMAKPSTLERRLSAIMDETRNRRPLRGGAWLAGGGSVMILVVLCASMQLSGAEKGNVKPPGALQSADGTLPQFEIEAKFIEASETGVDADFALLGKETLSADETKALLVGIGQRKGLELLSSRRITIRAGQEGGFESGRSIVYAKKLGADRNTPVEFDLRLVGLTLRVTPALDEAGRIRLRLIPARCDVVGWMSDAKTGQLFEGGPDGPVKSLPKENRLGQPVFREQTTDRVAVLAAGESAVCALTGITVTPGFETLAKPPRRVWCLVSAKRANGKTAAYDPRAIPKTQKKAMEIVLPRVKFVGATLDEAMNFLRAKSMELDLERLGIDFLVTGGASAPDARISLDLKNIPLAEALNYITETAGLKYQYQEYEVRIFSPAAEVAPADALITKSYRVSQRIANGLTDTRHWLEVQGVAFPNGANAALNKDLALLIVRNTASELHKTDTIVDKAAGPGYPALSAIRAQAIILPRVNFIDATLEQALDLLRGLSVALDPAKEGLNIVLLDRPMDGRRVSLDLRNVPVSEALDQSAKLVGLRSEYRDTAVRILSAERQKEELRTTMEASKKEIEEFEKEMDGSREKSFLAAKKAAIDAPSNPMLGRAKKIVVPTVEFQNASVEEAIAFLMAQSLAHDPEKRGISILLRPSLPGKVLPKVTVSLRQVPLDEALRSLAERADLELTIAPYAVLLESK